MSLPSSDEEEQVVEKIGKEQFSRKRKLSKLQELSATKKRLNEQEEEELIESTFLSLSREIENQVTSSEEEEESMGVVEPRPPEVTSWKQKVRSNFCISAKNT